MEVKTFNSDQEAFDAGFRNPMGNGTYARDDGPMEQAAHLVRDWIADFGLALSDIEEGELIRRIALRAACDEPAKAGFNAGWNAAMEEAAKLMEDWMERNELVAPIASAIRKMKSRPKRCLNDEDRFHWLWAIAERSRLLVSEWHKYRDPIAPPLLDQLAELRNLLGQRPAGDRGQVGWLGGEFDR